MADPIAAAFVTVAADTKPFVAQIEALRLLAAKPIVVPVTALGGANGAAGMQTASASIQKSLGGVHASSVKAGQGMLSASSEANAARGALIGLARVTPVAVFGLGVIGTAAIAAGLAIKGSVNAAAQLEQQLNIFQSVTGATAAEMAAVSAQAKALGGDLTLPATSANDAATAMTELAKAGLTVNDTLAASRGVVELAAAANITAGQAATITATQLNAFGLAGSEATKITDLLAGASIAAQGEITDFAAAFQQVSAVSHQVGLSVEDTTGLLTELAKAGLRGADGGTSLRTTLLRLVPTTKQAKEYVDALGISINQQIPIGQQITSVIEQYRVALLKLTPIQQQETLTQIFGQDAIRAASIIFTQEPLALNKLVAQVSEAGSGARLAEARMKGFAGSVEGLKSAAQTLGGTLGAVVIPALTSVVTTLSSVTTAATEAAGAISTVGGATVKPVVNALGGADTFVQPALLLGAGFGIKKLADMRAASKLAASSASDAIRMEMELAQTANLMYAKLSTSAVAAADVQIGAATNVTAALARQTVIQKEIAANNAVIAESSAAASRTMASSFIAGTRSMLTANKALVAGLALSVGGGALGGTAGNFASNVGLGIIGGSFFGVPGAVAGGTAAAFLTFLQSASAKDAADKAKIKAEWDKLTYAQQLGVLRRIDAGEIPKGVQGLQTLSDIMRQGSGGFLSAEGLTLKPRPFAGRPTPDAAAAIRATIPDLTVPSLAPASGGITLPPDTQELVSTSQTYEKFFKNFQVANIVLPKVKAEAVLSVRNQIDLNVAMARLSGSTGQLTTALERQAEFDRKLIETLQNKLTAPNAAMSGFLYSAKERAAIAKALGVAIGDLNGVLGELTSIANQPFTISTGTQIAQINAGASKGLQDNLTADRTAFDEITAALNKELAKKKQDKDKIDTLRIQQAEANAAVTQDLAAIEADNLAAQKKQIADAVAAAARAQAQRELSRQLRDAIVQTQLSNAELTPGTADNIKAYNKMIANDNADIKRNEALYNKARQKGQSGKKYLLAIQEELQDINRLKGLIKGQSASSGFSLSDLFKEALNQFQEFGSNVSSSPLTPGGVRGAFGGAIAAQNPKLTRADKDKIAVASESNDLLRQILATLKGSAPTGSTASSDSSAGVQTSVAAAKYGKFRSV